LGSAQQDPFEVGHVLEKPKIALGPVAAGPIKLGSCSEQDPMLSIFSLCFYNVGYDFPT